MMITDPTLTKLTTKLFNGSNVLYGHIPQNHDGFDTILTDYPQSWLDHYIVNESHRIDPVAQSLRTPVKPFQWGQSHFKTSKRLQELYANACEVGMLSGFIFRFTDSNFISLVSDQPEQEYKKFLNSEKHLLLPKLFMLNSYFNLIQQPNYCHKTAAQLSELIKVSFQEQQRRRKALRTALHYCKAFATEIDMTLPGIARQNLLFSFRHLYKYFEKL